MESSGTCKLTPNARVATERTEGTVPSAVALRGVQCEQEPLKEQARPGSGATGYAGPQRRAPECLTWWLLTAGYQCHDRRRRRTHVTDALGLGARESRSRLTGTDALPLGRDVQTSASPSLRGDEKCFWVSGPARHSPGEDADTSPLGQWHALRQYRGALNVPARTPSGWKHHPQP